MGGFGLLAANYIWSRPNVFNPNPTYDLDIPLRFNYYYYGAADYSGTPNFAITIWLRGTTQVQDTIIAGQPFTMTARADQANSSSPLNDTRLITIFFQDSLAWPASNDSDLLPATAVVNLCQAGACFCVSPSTCYIPTHPNSTVGSSQYFWTTDPATFYFPISGSYSPVVRFFTLTPFNKTSLLLTVSGPSVGNVILTVQPATYAQEAYIENGNLALTIAIFILGAIEGFEAATRIIRSCILKEKPKKIP